jgi:hypothetical protein
MRKIQCTSLSIEFVALVTAAGRARRTSANVNVGANGKIESGC